VKINLGKWLKKGAVALVQRFGRPALDTVEQKVIDRLRAAEPAAEDAVERAAETMRGKLPKK